MSGADESREPTRSPFSLPPWPPVRLRCAVPWLVAIVFAVYVVVGIGVYAVGGVVGQHDLITLLLFVTMAFMGMGLAVMLTGFLLCAFDTARLLGTYFVGFGACFGVIGQLNLFILMAM